MVVNFGRKANVGYPLAVSAYFLWAVFPFYFTALEVVDPYEIIPWRVLTSLVFCLILLLLTRAWGPLLTVLRSPRLVWWFFVSALLLYGNWQLFVVAVTRGQILETALGYFMTPFVSILIGVFVRKERLSALQWLAVAIAGSGVIVSGAAYGHMPWIAVGLAFTFGFYGAVHQHASDNVDALTGLTVETLLVAPIAIGQLFFLSVVAGPLTSLDHGPVITLLLLGTGVVTAIPLLLFGAATRRLPLSHLGFIQFLTPVLNFLSGYFVFHEYMSPARWFGFIAVWVALLILLADTVRQLRSPSSPASDS